MYGTVALVLLFGLAQGLRCGYLSIVKLDGLVKQLSVVEQHHADAKRENQVLTDKVALYSSPVGVEELARERLDLVREDEVLVRIYPSSVAQGPGGF